MNYFVSGSPRPIMSTLPKEQSVVAWTQALYVFLIFGAKQKPILDMYTIDMYTIHVQQSEIYPSWKQCSIILTMRTKTILKFKSLVTVGQSIHLMSNNKKPGPHQSTWFLELLTDWLTSLLERLVTLEIEGNRDLWF